MKRDRFLLAILIGIGLLVILALVLFFIRRQSTLVYGPEDTPEGVVRNYLIAILRQDYDRAYGYLADRPAKPSYAQFQQTFLQGLLTPSNLGVDIGPTEIVGAQAYVKLYTQYNPTNLFISGYRSEDRAVLVRQGNQWKIEQMPIYVWHWEWYQLTPTPLKSP